MDQRAAAEPLARQIGRRLGLEAQIIDQPDRVYREISGRPDPEKAGKSVLLLTENKGSFIRECPGTSHYTCCGYKILHVGTYCPMDCTYCILQAYFHPPALHFFVNHDRMEQALKLHFQQGMITRIGTGEFTDSLVWERVYPLAPKLIGWFSEQNASVLELKTKTADVDHLLDLDHRRKTIMAWSLNTEPVIASEEHGTASLEARLAAAEKCQARGYRLAFHFDPMIRYEGCHRDYAAVVSRLFARIDPENVVWISLGSFRFMPALKQIICRRHPASKIVYGEFIRALDGKMRYFKPLRIDMYRRIIDEISKYAPGVMVYFCMEDAEVWDKALGRTPEALGGLPRMLDERAARMCGLKGLVQPVPCPDAVPQSC